MAYPPSYKKLYVLVRGVLQSESTLRTVNCHEEGTLQ
jgi:hypothetical protein